MVANGGGAVTGVFIGGEKEIGRSRSKDRNEGLRLKDACLASQVPGGLGIGIRLGLGIVTALRIS